MYKNPSSLISNSWDVSQNAAVVPFMTTAACVLRLVSSNYAEMPVRAVRSVERLQREVLVLVGLGSVLDMISTTTHSFYLLLDLIGPAMICIAAVTCKPAATVDRDETC